MVCSKVMKRTNRKNNKNKKSTFKFSHVPFFDSIPIELVTEIVARVASSSFTDLFNVKQSCKVLYKVADDKYIFQNVSIEKLSVDSWNLSQQASSFLKQCAEQGNPEALYRQGVVDYFSCMDMVQMKSGLAKLKQAVDSGHMGASYATAVILLFLGGKSKNEGMKILLRMMKKSGHSGLKDYRENFERIISSIWINPLVVGVQKPSCCTSHTHGKSIGYIPFENYAHLKCQACICDQVIVSIYHKFRLSSV